MTRGGLTLRSMIATVSGGGFGTTFTVPLTLTTLLSLAETAIWASPPAANPTPTTSAAATAAPFRRVMVPSPGCEGTTCAGALRVARADAKCQCSVRQGRRAVRCAALDNVPGGRYKNATTPPLM